MMLDAHAFGMAERLRNHNGYLDSLIEMVPAKYYFPPDPDEMVKKFQKHVNKPAAQCLFCPTPQLIIRPQTACDFPACHPTLRFRQSAE